MCDQNQLSILAEECQTKSQPDEFKEFYQAKLYEPLEKLFRSLSHKNGTIKDQDINDLCQVAHLYMIEALKKRQYSMTNGYFLTWAGTIYKNAAKRLLNKYNACAVTKHGIVKKTASMSDLFSDDELGDLFMDTQVMPESLDPNRILDLRLGYFSKKLRNEMSRYRDWYSSKGEYYIPAYVWIILRIKISMLLFAFHKVKMPYWNEVENQVPWINDKELKIYEPNWCYHNDWKIIKEIWDEITKRFQQYPSPKELDKLFFTLLHPEDSRKQWMKKCREDKMRMKRSIGRFTGITIDDEFLMGKLILDIEKYHAWRKKGGKGFLKTAENF